VRKGHILVRRSIQGAIVLGGIAGALAVISLVITKARLQHGNAHPFRSSRAAESYGLLVCRVAVDPVSFNWHGTRIAVEEAWLEEAAEIDYYVLWFPQYSKLGWYNLCFTIQQGRAAFAADSPSFFVFPESVGSFGSLHFSDRVLFWHRLHRSDAAPCDVLLRESWTDGETLRLHFSW
jgi:hypothetical protein